MIHANAPVDQDLINNVTIRVNGSGVNVREEADNSVITHPGSINNYELRLYSPNNFHLTGLPEAQLNGTQNYGFISYIDGGNDIHADTYHLLLSNMNDFQELAQQARDFGHFLDLLNTYGEQHPEYRENIQNLIRFVRSI